MSAFDFIYLAWNVAIEYTSRKNADNEIEDYADDLVSIKYDSRDGRFCIILKEESSTTLVTLAIPSLDHNEVYTIVKHLPEHEVLIPHLLDLIKEPALTRFAYRALVRKYPQYDQESTN